MTIKPRAAGGIKDTPHKLRAMPPQHHLPPVISLEQGANACAIEHQINRIKSENGFIGERAGVILIANPHIAPQPQPARQPSQREHGGK